MSNFKIKNMKTRFYWGCYSLLYSRMPYKLQLCHGKMYYVVKDGTELKLDAGITQGKCAMTAYNPVLTSIFTGNYSGVSQTTDTQVS